MGKYCVLCDLSFAILHTLLSVVLTVGSTLGYRRDSRPETAKGPPSCVSKPQPPFHESSTAGPAHPGTARTVRKPERTRESSSKHNNKVNDTLINIILHTEQFFAIPHSHPSRPLLRSRISTRPNPFEDHRLSCAVAGAREDPSLLYCLYISSYQRQV